ncbi:hypothetical protein PanWU01x14_336240 [Parasponia andersonii]|uniref:Uncharacterized protein n=1 Tax=Parasponia andersonii TaxID=3476 RepID=A0A2P5AG19_PARAD|nr:hypothetical protein PanWU01x14_336240 [Parasponia andersonii]
MVVIVVLTLHGVLLESHNDESQEFFEYKDLDDDNDDLANARDDVLRTVTNIYTNRKTELSEHFRLIGGGKNALDLEMGRSKVPNKMDVVT